MKENKLVGIITPFYSENCGTVLQATCLFNIVKEMGYNPVFIDTKTANGSHSVKKVFGRILRSVFKLQFSIAISYIKKYFYFSRFIGDYPVMKIEQVRQVEGSIFIVGSDTVWNLKSKNFTDLMDRYWPIEPGHKVISYAASVANSDQNDLSTYKRPVECLKMLDYVGVRDEYSKEIVERHTTKPVIMCCDPTFLYEKSYFDKMICDIEHRRYMFVYLFEQAEREEIKQIKEYAQDHKLKIISYGNLPWVDECVDASLENFLSYFKFADCIITNTFHGTVFSIINNKRFVCLKCSKTKIDELLLYFDLSTCKDENLSVMRRLDAKMDWNAINDIIEKLRKESLDFLSCSLSGGTRSNA